MNVPPPPQERDRGWRLAPPLPPPSARVRVGGPRDAAVGVGAAGSQPGACGPQGRMLGLQKLCSAPRSQPRFRPMLCSGPQQGWAGMKAQRGFSSAGAGKRLGHGPSTHTRAPPPALRGWLRSHGPWRCPAEAPPIPSAGQLTNHPDRPIKGPRVFFYSPASLKDDSPSAAHSGPSE